MRKKSHLSLAWYLMNSEGMTSLQSHKGSFYIGSILPDCVPSFLVKRHTFDDAFGSFKEELAKILKHFAMKQEVDSYFCIHLGILLHYTADFFTFPHNSNYPGNIKDHCSYEEDLKVALRSYLHNPDSASRRLAVSVHTPEEITSFIARMHDLYMKITSAVERDIEYIVFVCFELVDELLLYLSSEFSLDYTSMRIAGETA
ncbi:MAG: zinc dependent phospholipase C family protein [Lachnospiraceae bacterium]|jgi:hypothetical protein|nr:zinc dependent phospholipase C family protein [Lachnospiraceae bacterium]MEE3461822.1 zinc dependent phospholipase C family protein [Lachnospiraceae bacterium]